jgi:hypothetical protein
MKTREKVEYRDVPGFPGYCVGSDGGLWSCRLKGSKAGRLADEWHRISPTSTGRVLLSNGKDLRRVFLIARLILTAFAGPAPPGMVACYRNRDKTDLRPSNLYWGERSSLPNVGKAKLTRKQADEIRRAIESGQPAVRVAARYGVHRSLVYRICNGQVRNHIEA